jgi:hypothetical protein
MDGSVPSAGTSEHHKMLLAFTYGDNFELWYCPECGYCFRFHWPPQYDKQILIWGNPFAQHCGSKNSPGASIELNKPVIHKVNHDPNDEWIDNIARNLGIGQ